jgi:hypothetical protein
MNLANIESPIQDNVVIGNSLSVPVNNILFWPFVP